MSSGVFGKHKIIGRVERRQSVRCEDRQGEIDMP
jgi:hypothetical protein